MSTLIAYDQCWHGDKSSLYWHVLVGGPLRDKIQTCTATLNLDMQHLNVALWLIKLTVFWRSIVISQTTIPMLVSAWLICAHFPILTGVKEINGPWIAWLTCWWNHQSVSLHIPDDIVQVPPFDLANWWKVYVGSMRLEGLQFPLSWLP